jgi:hypothetical protein
LVEAVAAAIRSEHGHGVKLVALVRGILEIDATKKGSVRAEDLDPLGTYWKK